MTPFLSFEDFKKQIPPYVVGTFGHPDFDSIYGPIKEQQLILLGGRTGMGKTTFLLQLAKENMLNGKRILYITVNQSKYQIWEKMGNFLLDKVPYQETEFSEKQFAELTAFNDFFVLVDASFIDFLSFENNIEQYRINHKIDLVIIDDFQNIQLTGKDDAWREKQSVFIQNLRRFINNNGIPFILSLSLGREVEYRCGDKRPQVSDFISWEGLEDVADKIIMIHRPEYYGFLCDEHDAPYHNISEVLVIKNKQRSCGESRFVFNDQSRTLSYSKSCAIYGGEEHPQMCDSEYTDHTDQLDLW